MNSCAKTSRRILLKHAVIVSGLSVIPFKSMVNTFVETKGENDFDTRSLYELFPKDKIDLSPNYLKHWNEESLWHEEIDSFFENVLSVIDIPEGWIVEVGTYKARSFKKFCSRFGVERCLGFEAYPYVQHPAIVVKDIRSVNREFDRPVAFGWNNASNWEGSPRSKLAALNYLTRNIVKGGYLLEDSLPDLPRDIVLSDFKVVCQSQKLVLLQRVS